MKISIKHIAIIFVSFFLFSISCFAQDIHFSQFDVAPLTINPASAGVMEGDFRLSNNYKSQWSSVANVPYTTISVALDAAILKQKNDRSYFGAGLSVYNDRAGKSKMGTTQYNLTVSTIQALNENNYMSVGLQGGYAQRAVSYDGLSWDNQFNGDTYDPNLSSGESSLGEKKNYLDVGAGLQWISNPSEKTESKLGVAIFHVNKPNKSFSDNADKMNMKIVAHWTGNIKLHQLDHQPDRFFLPKIVYYRQGPHQELLVGAFIRYMIQGASRYTNYRNQVTVDFGGLYRIGDAVIASVSFDYGRFKFGVSYDVNVSGLRTASTYRGGLEVALVYSGLFESALINVRGIPKAGG